MNYKWKRCQECGAEAHTKEQEVKYGHEVRVSCPGCDDQWMSSRRWDSEQHLARARKRFELVKAVIGGDNAAVFSPFERVKIADNQLAGLYGPEPGANKQEGESK